jgi:superfamily II DNA or RNA helicase
MLETLDRKIWDDPTHSVVIFSQFTSYLSLLEKIITKDMIGVKVMKFTGSMSSEERNDVVKEFTTSTYPRVLLISLMAGGVGLNLLPCSTVFLSEPYYNPFLEKQAEERVHRLGQKNQVNVYRFSMKNSVETWINGLKQKKLFLASGLDLLAPHEQAPVDFSFEDLAELFNDLVAFQKTDKQKHNKSSRIVADVRKNITEKVVEEIGIDCSICLDDVGTRTASNLGCGHLFHTDCITKWKNINNTCPMCKSAIRILL